MNLHVRLFITRAAMRSHRCHSCTWKTNRTRRPYRYSTRAPPICPASGPAVTIDAIRTSDRTPDIAREYHSVHKYSRKAHSKSLHSSRRRNPNSYESEQRYLCNPSRNDVLKLLIGLDEGRKGNHGRTVNFCNRKRPAKAIFSNIRFLG